MELNGVKETGTPTDVLVVGAGPTGLALAIDLARRGVRTRVVEKAGRLFPGSRGKGIQPRTQEVLDDLGVIDAVHAAGGVYPTIQVWENGERANTWDMMERFAPTPHAPYGEAAMIPQWRTQEILHARLRELGGTVEFGTAVTALSQDADSVTAELSTGEAVRASYLVAGDGGRSTVRQALGIGMTGETVDPKPILVADVRVDGVDRQNIHAWMKGEGGSIMLQPLPGTRDFQLLALYADPDAVPDTSADGIRKLIATRTHLPADALREVLWASDFRPRAALADRFRSGRVFLAGDAAHIHSPAGGQGLNTSVQDAYNLGWKLGHVLLHGADPALLDTYEAERLPIAAEVLGMSTRIHRTTIGTGTTQRGAETQQLGIGYPDGPLTLDTRPELPALPEGALHAGDRAPDAPLPDGRRLFDLFRGPHFTLLALGAAPSVTDALPGWVHVHRVAAPLAREAYGDGLFVIRPDGYVGLATAEPADVLPYLARFGA